MLGLLFDEEETWMKQVARRLDVWAVIGCSYGTLYNRNLYQLVDQLLHGGPASARQRSEGRNARDVKLRCLPVPKAFANRSFQDLFLGVLRTSHQVVIALYRAKGSFGSLRPYVVTNPVGASVVHSQDMMYIIG